MSDDPAKIILGETALTAIEPSPRRFIRRGKDRQSPPLTHCENCGAQLCGHWCAQCGQPAIDYRRSFRHVIVDVLDSFLNWDSKFAATLGWLIFRPWFLTNDFLRGRRVRYVHPLRLYLLASIAFFFVVNYGAKSINVDPAKLSAEDRAEVDADLAKENISPEVRERVRRALKSKGVTQPDKKTLASPAPALSPPPTAGTPPQPSAASSPKDSEFGPFLKFDKPASDGIGKWLEERAKEKMGEHGGKMALFIKTLLNNLPYMMLCCIPLFAFVLKILYIRKGIFYIDHLIYALHIHTFAYVAIMLIAAATIGLGHLTLGVLGGWLLAPLWIAFAVQILLSIRRVYRQSWFFTTFKFFAGGFVYLLVLLFALAATFFVTLALP